MGYCAFLEKHQDTIKEIFGESKSDNLRTLKIWLTDFETSLQIMDRVRSSVKGY